MKKTVTVRVTIPAETARALTALAYADSQTEPRTLDNTLGWLGIQAVQLGTINPMVPLANIALAMGDVAKKWRAAQ